MTANRKSNPTHDSLPAARVGEHSEGDEEKRDLPALYGNTHPDTYERGEIKHSDPLSGLETK